MKKILVTGGAGFIGSHILEKCSEVPGLSVTVLDNLSSGFKEYVPLSMNLVQMDVRDKALIDFLLQEKFDTVIHLAAQTLVPFSMEYPLVDADINIKGLINLLEGCRKSGVKRIIFSSNAAVYGDNQHLPPYGKGNPSADFFLRSIQGDGRILHSSLLLTLRDAWNHPAICQCLWRAAGRNG